MSSTSPVAGFTFSDLFAGVGGFHAALHAAGGRWAFASEIDAAARAVYDYNWLRPLRVAGAALPEGVESFTVSGDIVALTDPTFVGDSVRVPPTDVLAAGFPCQPFSKSGFQRGMDETRGTLFWNIARVLADEKARPSVVLLENVRNLAGPRHTETFETIVATLRQLGYRTADKPAVFSPHLIPPHLGGRPQVRERVFILAHYAPESAQVCTTDEPIVTPKTHGLGWDKKSWNLEKHLPLEKDADVDSTYDLGASEMEWVRVWNDLLVDVSESPRFTGRLPGHPIWFDEFRSVPEAEAMIEGAENTPDEIPSWKANFLIKNAEFYEQYRAEIEPYREAIKNFPDSRRKFEWQAGEPKPLSQTILHFRPSGIRCKMPDYVPALVAINQTSILARPQAGPDEFPQMRRLTPTEAARLQGLQESFEFRQTVFDEFGAPSEESVEQKASASYKQMGNGVNVGVAYHVFREYVLRHREEIRKRAPHLVEAVEQSPESPDLPGS